MSFITGVGLTAYGKREGCSTLDLMSEAATLALADSGLKRAEIDGVLCGYSTTMPHLMLATVFAEHFGIQPKYAHAIQVGGATRAGDGHARASTGRGRCRDQRAGGRGREPPDRAGADSAIQTLAQVGHPNFEVPLGPTIPAYYGLVASRYMHEFGITEEQLAEFAVLMRTHALLHPGAQFREPITVADVMASRSIATPLKLLDCCPVSDGGAAFIVSREPVNDFHVRIMGCGQAHRHQHVTMAGDVTRYGASDACNRAMAASGVDLERHRLRRRLRQFHHHAGDPARGDRHRQTRRGGADGAKRRVRHQGQAAAEHPWRAAVSYGHCGTGGAMAHVVETHLQMTGRAGARQVREASLALMHGDGGILSSHVSMFVERVR